jgi:parallel beta-helix repeat protein
MLRFWSIALCALVIASSSIVSPTEQDAGEIQPEIASTSALIAHAPIAIDGDAGFLGINSSTGISRGNGTHGDPYIITGWRIDAAGFADAISVSNSSVFFVIKGCRLSNASWAGIELTAVSNATLDGNDCSGNRCGVSLRSSRNNSLYNNICAGNPYYGIALISSNDNLVTYNTCSGSECGMDMRGSNNNSLVNNTCSGNIFYGIALMASDDNLVKNSTCFHDQFGIDLHLSDNNTVLNNSCSNDQYGIWMGFSFNNSVVNNTCSIDQYGISLLSSDNNTISKNICLSNAFTGISADSSDNNTLRENICTGNQYGIDLIRLKNKVANETDYYFYKVGSTYYVKDNSTGLVIDSEFNARVLIQDTLDSLPSAHPVRFFFDSSIYVIDSSGEHEWIYYPAQVWEIGLRIDKQVTMICNGTTFKAANGLANPLMLFYMYDANYIEIRGAHIDCNQAGQTFVTNWVTGIMTRRADWLLVEKCDIEHFGGYGVFIDVNSSFPTIRYNHIHNSANGDFSHGISFHNNGEEGLIFGNRVEGVGNSKYGIQVDTINNVRVIGNYVEQSEGAAISIGEYSNDTVVLGNWIVRKNSFPSIMVSESNDTQLIGNYIFGNMSSGMYRGPIKVDPISKRTVIKNNYMNNAGIIDLGNGTMIFDNYGYLIEEAPRKYVVDFDGGNYRAENATGVLKYIDSNFSALMSSVMAGASNGSKIVFKEGTYIVENSGLGAAGRNYGLRVTKTLQFEGEAATFVMADTVDCDYSMILVDGAVDFRARGIAFDVNVDGQDAHSPSWSGCGIQVVGGIRPLIQKCDFYDFNHFAIDIDGSQGAQAALDCLKDDDRTFSRNTIYAITLSSSCSHNKILRNNCSDSTGYGLNIADAYSIGNRICNNTFFRNNCSESAYSTSHIQAYDGGINNWWNTSGLPYNYGNFWSDWKTPDDVAPFGIVDPPYYIYGSDGARDNYPLTLPVAPTLNLVPPITIPDLVGVYGANGWYISAVQVPYVSVANLTDYGIFHMYYRLDAGTLTDYDVPMTIVINGEHLIEFFVVDIAGNIIPVRSFSFNLDTQPPSPEITLTGDLSPSIWYKSNVTFNLLIHDYYSGVNLTAYRIDGAAWNLEDWHKLNISFDLTDGIHSVEYYTIDNASNTGSTKSLIIRIDTVDPNLEITSAAGTYKSANVTISWNSSDNISGIARYEIVVDGRPAIVEYNGTSSTVLELANGVHTVIVRAIDVAGNSAEEKIILTVDADTSPQTNPGGEIPILLLAIVVIGVVMLYLMVIRGSRPQQK